jgi:hypothetical protein
MTKPSEELRDTLVRVSNQNDAVRDAARRAAEQANARVDAEFQRREGESDAGANPGQ